MVLATTAAVLAGSSAAAAYLDAKFNLSTDLEGIYTMKRTEARYAKVVKANRISGLDFFLDAAGRYPEATCIWTRQRSYTWSQARLHIAQYANFFHTNLSLEPSSLCAFYLLNSASFYFAWLGLWAIGAAPAMINVNLSGDALVHSIKISGAETVLVDGDEKVQQRFEQVRAKIEALGIRIVTLSKEKRDEIEGGAEVDMVDEDLRRGVKGTDPFALFYTSGTTGYPKAVPLPMGRLGLTVSGPSPPFRTRSGPNGDRWYTCLPLYHGTGAILSMMCLLSGVSVAVAPSFSVSTFWSDVRSSESTYFVYVGELARYLLAAPSSPLDKQHKVRHVYGNGMRPDVWGKFKERFAIEEVTEFFTSTEGMLTMLNNNRGPWSDGAVGVHGGIIRWLMRNTYVPVEVDYETNEVVRDAKGLVKRRKFEEGGEILVGVPNEQAFPGYKGAEAATKKKFVRDVLRKGDLFYRSGDALRRDDEGRWWFMDRLGDTYRWKSENVSTAEVAEVIGKYPGVLEANVYGVLVPGSDGRAGCAAIDVEPSKLATFDWAGLAKHAGQSLPKYAVPVFIRVVAADVGRSASHNHKQGKGPLREEGADPALKGTKVEGGDGDTMLWMPPKQNAYVAFGKEDWENLVQGSTKL